jgi:hypothetical protein
MKSLRFLRRMPINGNGMATVSFFRYPRLLAMAFFLACPGSAEAAKKKAKAAIPLVSPAAKTVESAPAASPSTTPATPATPDPGNPGTSFQELNFNRTLVIEGKVEKPAVQFTLLKEPPPEKEIRFETSFLQNILKLDRENTFKAGETYGRE